MDRLTSATGRCDRSHDLDRGADDATKRRFGNDAAFAPAEAGQGLVEYALILTLVVIILILIVAVLGHQTQNLYSNVSNRLP